MKYDAIIVGAGHNGLTAACFMARAGLKTVIIEKEDQPVADARLDLFQLFLCLFAAAARDHPRAGTAEIRPAGDPL